MKKLSIIGFMVITGVLAVMLWLTHGFTMFEVQEDKLFSYSVPGKNFMIEVTRVAAGATTSDVIQIRRVYKDGRFDVIKSIDDYDTLISSTVIDKSRLRLILKNVFYSDHDLDTVEVAIE